MTFHSTILLHGDNLKEENLVCPQSRAFFKPYKPSVLFFGHRQSSGCGDVGKGNFLYMV